MTAAGFDDVKLVARFDPFAGTNKEATTRKFGVQGVNLYAVKRG